MIFLDCIVENNPGESVEPSFKASFHDTNYTTSADWREYQVFVHCTSCGMCFVAETKLPKDLNYLEKREYILFSAAGITSVHACLCTKPKLGRLLLYRVNGKGINNITKEFILDSADNFITNRKELAGSLKLTSEFKNFRKVKAMHSK